MKISAHNRCSVLFAVILSAALSGLMPSSLLGQETNSGNPPTSDGRLLITLQLAKQPDHSGEVPYTLLLPSQCSRCEVVTDKTYVTQNAREIDLALRVPKSIPLDLTVRVDPAAIRRILLEGTDLSFARSSDNVHFTLPAQTTDRINSAEFHTHIIYRGVDVRFEHADPERRYGPYASGLFPELQRRAAANLEFAQREAIFMLGLDTYVADEQIGTIMLMGFDTNEPHGHTDSPPHMHMHMRWPQLGGTQIGHYFINNHGLLTINKVTVTGWTSGHQATFQPGEPFTTFDLHGRGVFTHTITPEGWLKLGRPNGPTCQIQPITKGEGFDRGAVVQCPGFSKRSVQVNDDPTTGTLRVAIKGQAAEPSIEIYHYDRDTGNLLPGHS
jgi:hypothetical protein